MANKHIKQEPQNTGWTAVPQFGAWDQNAPGDTNYSVVFQKARDDRKQHKQNITQGGPLGQRQIKPPPQRAHYGQGGRGGGTFDSPNRQDDSVAKKKKILTYINCCIRP